MKKLFMVFILILIGYTMIDSSVGTQEFRVRVIANSNEPNDLEFKYMVRDVVMETLADSINSATNIDEIKYNVDGQLPLVERRIQNLILDNEISYGVNISLGKNYFEEKELNGKQYSKGNYESLVVELGKAKGENWWCLIFPPLSLLEGEKDNETGQVEVKFFIKELLF